MTNINEVQAFVQAYELIKKNENIVKHDDCILNKEYFDKVFLPIVKELGEELQRDGGMVVPLVRGYVEFIESTMEILHEVIKHYEDVKYREVIFDIEGKTVGTSLIRE